VHLPGHFTDGIRERDALPVARVVMTPGAAPDG
jgi:hypothetical protein